MKRFASLFLAWMMLFSLTACKDGGLSLDGSSGEEEDTGVKYGYIGDTLSTAWFDFTVEDVYSCSEYSGYTPAEGYKLVVAELSLKNNCGYSVDMWGDDFVIMWGDSDDDFDMNIPLAAGLSGDQFPDEYVLGINASKSGVSVFEVPEEYRDFTIGFMELFESETNPDGDEGDTYLVDFTVEDR